MTSRGMSSKMHFLRIKNCFWTYRWRSPESVVNELEHDYYKLEVKEFAFYDDALLTNHKNHLREILDKIISNAWTATFHTPNGLQCKLLDNEIARRASIWLRKPSATGFRAS